MPPRAKKTVKSKGGGKRHPLNVRTTFELRQSLEAAAMQSGRSLTQEAEARIESSFQQENAASVLEDQLKKWFRLADDQKAQIEKLRAEQKDTAIAFRVAHGRMQAAEAELAQTKVLEILVERAVRRALMPKRKHQIKVAQRTRSSRNKGG